MVQDVLLPGSVLRFTATRGGSLTGLSAFRLPPRITYSNWFGWMAVRAWYGGWVQSDQCLSVGKPCACKPRRLTAYQLCSLLP